MAGLKGRSGRKPQPRATVSAGRPEYPEHLNALGRECWEQACVWLDELGALSPIDHDALEIYATTYQHWRAACDTLESEGSVVTNERGATYPHPATHQMQKCMAIMLSYQKQFGFTPAARKAMKVEVEEQRTNRLAELAARRTIRIDQCPEEFR